MGTKLRADFAASLPTTAIPRRPQIARVAVARKILTLVYYGPCGTAPSVSKVVRQAA